MATVTTFLPSARSATAAATCCEVFISETSTWSFCALVMPGGTTSFAGYRSAPECRPAEELLEERRLADDHVDEVDPAGPVGSWPPATATSGATGCARSGRKM